MVGNAGREREKEMMEDVRVGGGVEEDVGGAVENKRSREEELMVGLKGGIEKVEEGVKW